jgi:anthranilate phosphoribosyltransferase
MIKQAIGKVVTGQNLTEAEMIEVMNQIMGGEATPAQVGSFITALRMKGETIDEIAGAARVMRAHATPIRVGKALDIDREEINLDRETILDTCGTGGSGTKSFNISTTVAFVVSACGVKVAKHGNRSISSACGSADVLEALGVNLNVTPQQVEACINEVGIGFLFAPALHGPLTNPAGADRQVLGVYDEKLVDVMARVLVKLGCRRGFIVHGMDGMDEVTLTGPTRIAEIGNGNVILSTIEPEDFGLRRCALVDLQGGDAAENAAIVKDVLAGKPGPRRDVVILNAAYALLASGLAKDVESGLDRARASIDEGLAMARLNGLVAMTNA